ncbi:TIP120-domain-containing protein [Auricularia subglabra TFB-10046 SS5]|nr:TIP120-domain-containing protein [Auricularia subglabra TFB-10046 SS5]
MQSPDHDFRFMALNDLMTEIRQDPSSYLGDEQTEMKVLNQVMALVEDKISEVKNQAVKCLGQLIKIVRENQMEVVVDKLIDFSTSKDEELRDIAGLALKTITSELPVDGKLAHKACFKLTPKLLNQLANSNTPPETLIETLAILSILITRFPAFVSSPEIQPQPLTVLTPLLSHQRPAVRKRAIVTLSQFLPHAPENIFPGLVRSVIIPALAPSASLDSQRTIVQLIGAAGRYSPQKIATVLQDVVPGVLNACNRDDDELRESALQTFEILVLRCPSEITPFLNSIIGISCKLIKHDPNYAGDEDEDEEMADDEDDEDDVGDEYSDDEDTSYKIRRSATKALAAIVSTRPELLVTLLKNVSPVLISRFADREETVKLEIWATYVTLLTQVRVYGGAPASKDVEGAVGVKRKRTEDEEMETDESPHALLRGQVPSLAKTLLKQLRAPKSAAATLQAGFNVLQSLCTVLPGSLSTHASQVIDTSRAVLSLSSNASSSTLHTTVLGFLALFFSSHSPPSFSSHLSSLTPTLLTSLGDKHPRIASEAFRVFSSLLNSLKPVKGQDWPEKVYAEAVRRLGSNETDGDVRERAEEVVGDLWICATDTVRGKGGREWEVLLRASGRADGAVKVVERVARDVEMDDAWVSGSIEWVLGVLRRSGRGGRVEAFACLDVLLRAYTNGLPAQLPAQLLPQLAQYLSTGDIALFAQALLTHAALLQLAPQVTFPLVEKQVLPTVYGLTPSPLISGATLDALQAFYASLVEADAQIATHIVPNLIRSLDKAPPTERSAGNVAKCVSRIVRSQMGVAAGVIAEFSKYIRKGSKAPEINILLSLLTLGEIGRFVDMAPQSDLFNTCVDLFAADSEELRGAAAFAIGNITIGNTHVFLPVLLKLVQSSSEKRLLCLHALKEVVTNCTHGQLEVIADSLWQPLFQNSEGEDSTRNMAAACLGKLTTAAPSRYLPQLQARLRDESPAVRATVVSAIRYTFADTAHSYDELLSPLIVDFLSLMEDADLTVRRLSLSALNAAARNKPQLIREHLNALLPRLYKETLIRPELIRVVQMGPWQHKVDDGLETRKTAYETMYTLLDTCLSRLDVHELLGRVLVGLGDTADEIKVLCHMMLFRLAQVAPTAVAQRLDEATPELHKTMAGATVTKDTVKQDLERAAEQQRSALRAIAALSKINTPGTAPSFDALVEELKRGTWASEFKELVEG